MIRFGRVSRDPFQRIDAPEPDFYGFCVVDLVDSSSKPLRDLAMPAQLKLSPEYEGTGEEHQTGYSVEQSGSNIIFRLESICSCSQTNFLELHLLL